MPTDLVKEIRDNLYYAKTSDRHNREAYRSNQEFLNGEQWEAGELERRRNKRLALVADQLNGPVDQIVNSVKENKPGPSVSPSGEGTDKEDAQIFEGLLRRIDYENRAWITFSQVMECATGGNFGCFEVDIEYKNDRSFERTIVSRPIPDANETVYFDPEATNKDRSDAEWAIQLTSYSKDKFKREFPSAKLNRSGPINSLMDYFSGITDPAMAGWVTRESQVVAKYWKFERENDILRLYSNGIAYWDSEYERIPTGVTEDTSVKGRRIEHKTLKWYITDGSEILKKGDWEGAYIPLFPCYGRERWIRGKRIITSMIQLAKQAQQAFNFAFTGACEVLSSSTKSPYVGLLGQFRSKMADWKKANTEIAAFLEYDEVELKNGQIHVVPPQKNLQEPPVQSFLAFCNMCTVAIQRAVSVFDATLGRQKSEQSGKAIQELQQQSQQGNFHWSDNLTVCLTHYYRAMIDLVQHEYDRAQVTQILRADGTPLQVKINEDFESGSDIEGNPITKHYKISSGTYAVTVAVGAAYDSELLANEAKVSSLIKVLPPELVAQAADIFIKLQNYGQLGDELAARLTPPQYRDKNDPAAMAQHLAQVMQQNQAMQQELQKLQVMIQTKQPELEVRKQIALIQAAASIENTRLKIMDNRRDKTEEMFLAATGLAHAAGIAAEDREHEAGMQDKDLESQPEESDSE